MIKYTSKEKTKEIMFNHLKIARMSIIENNNEGFYKNLEKYGGAKFSFLAHPGITPYHKFTRLDNLANKIFIKGSTKFNK